MKELEEGKQLTQFGVKFKIPQYRGRGHFFEIPWYLYQNINLFDYLKSYQSRINNFGVAQWCEFKLNRIYRIMKIHYIQTFFGKRKMIHIRHGNTDFHVFTIGDIMEDEIEKMLSVPENGVDVFVIVGNCEGVGDFKYEDFLKDLSNLSLRTKRRPNLLIGEDDGRLITN